MALDYFYDGQFRAYIVQVIRIFSGFQYSVGKNEDGTPKLRTVPTTFASQDKMVASIIRNNSENTILSTPQITCYMTGVEPMANRRQAPNHVDTRSVHEREIDKINNKYTSERGKSYTLERFMPVPYDLTFNVDIWTSNESQKQQLMEQILVLFNPGLDLQTSTNALDWTALSTIELQSIVWSSRGIPIGSSEAIDIATLTFRLPAWLNPPAKVTRLRVIEQIITNVSALDDAEIAKNLDFDGSAIDWARGDILARSIVTPGDHSVLVDGDKITLLGANTLPLNGLNETWNWINLFELYEKYRPGISQLRLKTNTDMDDHESDVIGTIDIDQDNPSILYWTVDPTTLPLNNLPAINGVIDPHHVWPGNTLNPLPAPVFGDRYMILNDITNNTTWGGFHAKANDIIEYAPDGTWFVAFNAAEMTDTFTLLNKRTGKQLSWVDGEWIITLSGKYAPGMWRIAL